MRTHIPIEMTNATRRQPALTVQVDVDTLRNLFVFYGLGDPGRSKDDPIYRLALPRFADLFDEVGVRATFFVIGHDLADPANRDVVRRLHAAGHEIANHTQTHDYDFGRRGRAQKRDEIVRAGDAIAEATGVPPVGFRAPGYDVDRDVLEVLLELGYRYDSSVLPSILNLPFKLLRPLLSRDRALSGYGSLGLCAAPLHAYRPDPARLWRSSPSSALWEIPVACVPYVRLPFYANFNLFTGDRLFRLSAALAEGRDCNYVFHAVEMLDPSEIDPRLHRRHPNALLPLQDKVSRTRRFIQRLARERRVVLSRQLAEELDGRTPGAVHTQGAMHS